VKFLVPRVTDRPFPTFDELEELLLLPVLPDPLVLELLLLHAASSRATAASAASSAARGSLR
jgi:hypothetical protein